MAESLPQALDSTLVHPPVGFGSTGRLTGRGRIAQIPAPRDLSFRNQSSVRIWSFVLDRAGDELETLKKNLSASELERCGRFHFERHQRRYAAARGWLREVLGRYVSIAPSDLQFQYGPHGKPSLAGAARASRLQFNLTHSEGLALLAITPQAQVGVDLEQVRTLPDAGELVARFFTKSEAGKFNALPSDQKNLAFFNLWTRKEAWLKATGEGIAHLLDQVEVSFLPGEPAQLLSLPKSYTARSSWSLWNFSPAEGFVAAVAVEGEDTEPVFQTWDDRAKGGSNELHG